MAINCCNGCIAPKRHPGCHGHCIDYVIDKAFHDADMEIAKEKKKKESNLNSQTVEGIFKAYKKQQALKRR